MNTISKIIEKLEYSNIQVEEYKENGKLCGYELNTYTDAGVNQIIFLDFRAEGKNIKDPKEFIAEFNQRISDIDIDEELIMLMQDNSYVQQIGLIVGLQDLKDWKENLLNIFNTKTPQQRQFEQVVDKFRTQLQAMQETLEMMPSKGQKTTDCQKLCLTNALNELEQYVTGIELEDFTPNGYSGDFKLSYS